VALAAFAGAISYREEILPMLLASPEIAENPETAVPRSRPSVTYLPRLGLLLLLLLLGEVAGGVTGAQPLLLADCC